MKKFISPPNSGGMGVKAQDFPLLQKETFDVIEGYFSESTVGIIISGCENNGTGFNPGIVYLNGKYIRFNGSGDNSTKYLTESAASIEQGPFKDGNQKDKFTEPTVTAVSSMPSGVQFVTLSTSSRSTWINYLFIKLGIQAKYDSYDASIGAINTQISALQAIDTALQAAINSVFRPGMTQMFIGILSGNFNASGLGIGQYTGWGLCNGQDGRPDMRGRFPVGYHSGYAATPTNVAAGTLYYNYGALGNTGGEDWHKLLLSESPRHNHINGAYSKILKVTGGSTVADTDNSATEPDIVNSATMSDAGGDGYHENRPPYFVTAFIIKL